MIWTNRLFLHDFSINDLDRLHELNSNPEVMLYLNKPEGLDQTKNTLDKILQYNNDNPGLGFAICLEQETNKFVGWFCLSQFENTPKIEISYRLFPEYVNCGYAKEMGAALLNYGFTVLDLNIIVGIAHPDDKTQKEQWEDLGLNFIDLVFYNNTNVAYYEGVKHAILN